MKLVVFPTNLGSFVAANLKSAGLVAQVGIIMIQAMGETADDI